ncbi:MAG: class I SAM-dependent methyltransferase [Bryobacteraceae bacterium]
MDSVARHYGIPGLLDTILSALRSQGKDIEQLTPDDLAPADEFHIRGREATIELAELAGVRSGWRVLDVGSGLGGSARFLAAQFGCHVTGIDLTPEYCETASALSRRVGLDHLIEFRCASALAMPFEDAAFDLAWTQHVQMNIEDKPALYREIARVLRPGGRFALHDILAGPGGPPHFPVHWAEEASLSFLIAADELRQLLECSGFRVLTWLDTTEISLRWYQNVMEQRRKLGPPPLGLHLLLGPTGPAKVMNFEKNLLEERIRVGMGVLERV